MYTFVSRVRYSEVNSNKRMTLAALLDYLQDCCTFQSEELGVGVDYLARERVAWVLSSWEIEILRYPAMGEEIRVMTWPYDFKGFYGYRNFCVEDAWGETLVRANSVWVFMDMERMRPTRICGQMVDAYRGEIAGALPGSWANRKTVIPLGGEKGEPMRVARFHIDTNHHMNNGRYVQFAEEFLPGRTLVGRLRVEYKNAAVLGDVLYPKVTEEAGCTTVVLSDQKEKPYAIVQFSHRVSD